MADAREPGITWPPGLLERVKAAEQRIHDNHAPRRIPADPHGYVDLVLAEVRYLIEGNWPPFWIKDAAGVPAPTFCAYCGGNDETPQDHCMDCQRPGNVPVCSSCGGAGCVDCATDGVSVARSQPSAQSPTDGSAALRTLSRLSKEMGEEL